jgi:hypothetical protein
MGALLHYLHHRQLSFDEKDESYPGVIARDSGRFHLRTQLNDALIACCAGDPALLGETDVLTLCYLAAISLFENCHLAIPATGLLP